MENEIRSYDPAESELKATRRGRTVEGRAIVFNKESNDLGGFKEIIEPSALDGILADSDILACLNHDENRGVLARYTCGQGSMEVTVDNRGVNYRFEAPDTPLGDEVLSGIRRNEIRTSSFKFSKLPDSTEYQTWEKRSDGSYLRRIKKFVRLLDFSPVYREAYQDTTCAVRSMVEIRSSEAKAELELAAKKIADLEEELRTKSPSETTDVETKPVEVEKVVEEKKPSYAELESYYKNLEEKLQ
jgi:uncharacterized protein